MSGFWSQYEFRATTSTRSIGRARASSPAHLGFRVLIRQQAHDVRGDETRAARDEDRFRHLTRRTSTKL